MQCKTFSLFRNNAFVRMIRKRPNTNEEGAARFREPKKVYEEENLGKKATHPINVNEV